LSKRAIIFGANGQDGQYLSNLCGKNSIDVLGVSRSGTGRVGDVGNFNFVSETIAENKPDYVFHLAANSTTRHNALFENHATISTGTLNILESVHVHCRDCKVFITGSGLQFVNNGQPLSERDEFAATSAYVVSRNQSIFAARYYRSLGIKAYVGYLFHHDSPLRSQSHVSAMVAMAAKRIAAGDTRQLMMGDLSVRKEWGHARDIVEGIWTLVNQDRVFESAIGTGVDFSIQDWVERCFSTLGLDWRDWVQQTHGFQAEYSRLLSNPSTMNDLGWHPRESLSSLAFEMLGVKSLQ
jgi:GDPmannose 4,6-dehydratase